MFYYIKFRVLVWNHDVLQSWFILWVFHRAAYLCMASVWLSGATSQRQTQGFFQPAAPKGIWGRSVFHPNHRIYLPSSEGQPVRGDRVCLEKGRGPECVRVFECVFCVGPCLLEGWRAGLGWHSDCVTLGSFKMFKNVDVMDPKRKTSQSGDTHPTD